jgi:opacity protein-like surface antigen
MTLPGALLPLLTAVSLLGLAGGARAQAYAGVSAGQSQYDIDCSGTTYCDDTGVAYKAYLGWTVNDNVAIETAFYQQGKVRSAATLPVLGETVTDVRGQGLGLFGVLLAPYSKRFNLFGKLGFVTTRVKLDTRSAAGGGDSRSESHTNIAWGIGGDYGLTDTLGLRLEYERARVKFQDHKRDVDMVTAGLTFRF